MLTPEDSERTKDRPLESGPPTVATPPSPMRLWLWRLFLVVVAFIVYSNLPDPFDTWFVLIIVFASGTWLYKRVSGRMKLPPLRVKMQRLETITITDLLLALLLLVLLANHAELVNVKKATYDVEGSVTGLENSASDNTDEIKSSLDEVKSAVEASQ